MVLTTQGCDSFEVRILARGNFSLGASGLVGLLAALTGVTLGLAGMLAWQGYWPVLLIAMIQIILVIWTLIRAWERAWVAEIIDVGPEWIEVTQQRHTRKRQCQLQAAWARVELQQPDVAWYGPRVILKSRGEEIELGQFLTIEEKDRLAEYVRRAIRKHSAM